MKAFRLYPIEGHFCSFADYGCILDVMERYQPKSVLEFGPGWSTLALVEGGVEQVAAMEDDPHWMRIAAERLRGHDAVHLMPYVWSDPLRLAIDEWRFDMAVIDGPREVANREAVIRYCLPRCKRVLVPLECANGDDRLGRFVESLNVDAIELMHTGPLAGMFALLTP